MIADFDLLGNDLIRFVGFGFNGAETDQARRDALAAATAFDGRGAEIDLDAIGGDGTILLAGVRSLSFTSAEDSFSSHEAPEHCLGGLECGVRIRETL